MALGARSPRPTTAPVWREISLSSRHVGRLVREVLAERLRAAVAQVAATGVTASVGVADGARLTTSGDLMHRGGPACNAPRPPRRPVTTPY